MNLNEVEQEKKWQHNCCKDKEHNVRLCKGDNIKIDEEFVVNYIDLGKQIMIVASGSTVSLAGNDWLVLYFKEFELEIGEMKNMSCRQSFCFRPGKRYVSMETIEVPIVVEKTNGSGVVLKVQTYMVDAKVSFLLGKKTLKLWNSKLDMKNNILEMCIDGLDKDINMVDTLGNHCALVLHINGDKMRMT